MLQVSKVIRSHYTGKKVQKKVDVLYMHYVQYYEIIITDVVYLDLFRLL